MPQHAPCFVLLTFGIVYILGLVHLIKDITPAAVLHIKLNYVFRILIRSESIL
jgi:hypothetical protein